jgi:hypothetical protein
MKLAWSKLDLRPKISLIDNGIVKNQDAPAPAATGDPSMAKARKKSVCQQSPPNAAVGADGVEQCRPVAKILWRLSRPGAWRNIAAA